MTTYKRVFPETTVSDDAEYVVMARYKDEPSVKPFVRHRGSYDECHDYATRNTSEDNVESYYVAEVGA